jgi:hypothetical protein
MADSSPPNQLAQLPSQDPGPQDARSPHSHRAGAWRARVERLRSLLRLDTLATGTWRAKTVAGEEIRINMKAEAVAFEKSRVELHADVELGIQVPSIRSRDPRVFKLGPVHERVATPTLPRINLSTVAKELAASFVLSSVRADEVTADVGPIRDVQAGEVQVDTVELRRIEAPVGGVALGGIRVGRTRIDGVEAEAGRAADGQVDRVALSGQARAQDVVLRGATILGGRAAAAEGDDLNLGFEVQLPALTIKTFPSMPSAIERLVTRLSVRIEPKVVFQIGNLRLEGLCLTTRVGSLRIGELSLPLEARGAQLTAVVWQRMGLEGIDVGGDAEDGAETDRKG